MASDDLLSVTEARQWVGLGINDTSKDSLLASWVTSASRALVSRVGTIIYGTVTGELHNGGCSFVYLDHFPVQGVVQVVEYDNTTAGTLTAETNTSKPDNAYQVNLTNGKITRRSGNATTRFPIGSDNIRVTYVAGRSQGTLVDDRFKTACGLILKNAWRTFENQSALDGEFDIPQASFPRFAIPNSVKDLLADEWQAGV